MSACSQCGTVVKPADKFCNVCGSPIARANPATPGVAYPPPGGASGGPLPTGGTPALGAGGPSYCQAGHEIPNGLNYCAQGHPAAGDPMLLSGDPFPPGYPAAPGAAPPFGGAFPGQSPPQYAAPQVYAQPANPAPYGTPPPYGAGAGAPPYGAPNAAPYAPAPVQSPQLPANQAGYGQPPPQGQAYAAPPNQAAYAAAFGAPAGQPAPPPAFQQSPAPQIAGYGPPAGQYAPAGSPPVLPGLGGDGALDASPARVLRGFLVAYGTNPSGDFWPLTAGRHTIGRFGTGDGLDIPLQDPTISSRHAALLVDAGTGTIAVEDTGSTNGTFVNDEPIGYGGRRDLRDGDRVRLGGFTTIVKVVGRV